MPTQIMQELVDYYSDLYQSHAGYSEVELQTYLWAVALPCLSASQIAF